MPDFLVRASGLTQAGDDLQTSSRNLKSILDDMDGQLTPLKSQWTGEASTQYQAAKARWDQTLEDMTLLLADISNLVHESNQNFQSADKRNAGRW